MSDHAAHAHLTPQARGCFITLEGVDGAGKSTHVAWIVDFLASQGIPSISTREPGGTPLGERLRELLLHESMSLGTETLLMFAARNEHLETLILPALASGTWVVCDRFTDASYAYQGGGRQMGASRIHALEAWVHPGIQPDRTFLFDTSPDLARKRRGTGREPDRFEEEKEQFFERTVSVYHKRAAHDPERFRLIDTTGSMEVTRARLQAALEDLIREFTSAPAST